MRALLGLLAEEERLRVIAALVLDGDAGLLDVARRAALDPRVAQRALARLETGGVVTEQSGQWQLHLDVLKDAVRAATPARTDDPGEGLDASTAAVLRAFVKDGRLVSIPVQQTKKRIVLDHIARIFEIGVRYDEKEVDAMLRAFHADYAALRRYLVDEHFLSREHGVYWRSGGSVEV